MPIQMRQAIRGTKRAQASVERFFVDQETVDEGAVDIFRYLRGRMRENFRTQGQTAGVAWADYTGDEQLYGLVKRIMLGKKYGERKLRWSPGNERLYPSLVSPGHPEHIEKVNEKRIQFGTSTPYASNHQYGVGRGPEWAGSPSTKQRRFLTITPRDAAEIRRIMARTVGI